MAGKLRITASREPGADVPGQAQGVPVARVLVDVMLKPEILDPQGQAV